MSVCAEPSLFTDSRRRLNVANENAVKYIATTKAKDVRIHVIAMGDPQTVGETALDMNTIKRIAKESGGEAFEALNRDELAKAYDEIGKLEPQLYESTTYRPKQSLHHYLMALVVAMYLPIFNLMSVLG